MTLNPFIFTPFVLQIGDEQSKFSAQNMINELRKLSVGAQAAKLTDTEDIQRARRISMENMEIFSPNRLKNKVKCFDILLIKLLFQQRCQLYLSNYHPMMINLYFDLLAITVCLPVYRHFLVSTVFRSISFLCG